MSTLYANAGGAPLDQAVRVCNYLFLFTFFTHILYNIIDTLKIQNTNIKHQHLKTYYII